MTEKELSQQAKDYLSQIKKTDRLIRRISETISGLHSSLTGTGTELKPDKVQSSHQNDQMAETIAKIVDFEKDMNIRIDELVDMKRDAFQLIAKLADLDQQNILIARYIQFHQWRKIALDLHYSETAIYKIHGKALLEFAIIPRE